MLSEVAQSAAWSRTPGRALASVLVAVALVCLSTTAAATVMEYADTGDLVEISDVALRGEVVEQKSLFDSSQGRVVTRTTFEVAETYMGEVDGRVTIEQWGGHTGEETSVIPGDARFQVGEEVVVFLRRGDAERDVLFLSAMAQSKFAVHRDGNAPIVSRDFSDLVLLEQKSDAEKLRVSGEVEELEAFEATLEELVGSSEGDAR